VPYPTGGIGWHQVVPGGVGQCQVAPGGARWYQVVPGGTRWYCTVEAVPASGMMLVMIPSKHPSVLDQNRIGIQSSEWLP
jgi:hypothetical protein